MPQYLEFFRNHPLLVLAFIGIVAGLVYTFVAGRAGGVRRLAPADATRLINSEDAVVVDVRSKSEFDQGHIINALNIPEAQIASQLQRLEKHKQQPVITVCRTGQLSARAAGALRREGFQGVHTLAGGLHAWQGANMPLTKK
jgi:rhodanese-related sulfurtransferase